MFEWCPGILINVRHFIAVIHRIHRLVLGFGPQDPKQKCQGPLLLQWINGPQGRMSAAIWQFVDHLGIQYIM